MMIRIDPMELVETSRVLGGAATEAADIGTQLAACVRCPMPPAVRTSVDRLVAAADAVLDSIAVQLHAEAVELARRAVIAANDSLVAATGGAVGGGPAGAFAAGSMVIGGNTSPSFTILNADGSPAGPMPSMAVIGGNSWSPPSMGSALTGVIGAPTGDGWGLMSIARMQQTFSERAQARIDQAIANPNSSPFVINLALNAQTSIGRSAGRALLPTKLDMETRAGRFLTWAEYYQRVPEAAPRSSSGLF